VYDDDSRKHSKKGTRASQAAGTATKISGQHGKIHAIGSRNNKVIAF
jgi:hypothetical protein